MSSERELLPQSTDCPLFAEDGTQLRYSRPEESQQYVEGMVAAMPPPTEADARFVAEMFRNVRRRD